MKRGKFPVKSPSKTRRRTILLPMGLLMLALAVFGWGLQYKLSLYQSKDSVSHLAPAAKLLSQKERPVASQSVNVHPHWVPVWPLLFFVLLAPGLYRFIVRRLRPASREGSHSPIPTCIRSVFVRPPPFFVPSFL